MGKSLKRNEDGMAMVLVIMAMLVFSLLGMASLSMANSNVDNSLLEREFQSAFYVAEAGVNYHTEVIKKNTKAAYDSTNTPDDFFNALETNPTTNKTYTTDLFHAQEGYIPEAKVELKRLDMSQTNPRTYAVVSHGITENAERIVLKTVQIKWVPKGAIAVDYAVFSKEMLDLKGGYIDGPAGSTTGLTVNQYGSIEDYYLPDEDSIDNKIGDWWTPGGTYHEIPEVSYPDPVIPECPTHTKILGNVDAKNDKENTTVDLTGDYVYYMEKLDITSSSRVTFDIGDKDVELIIDKIKIRQGHIFIKGTGKLKLYVKENFDVGNQGDSVINHPNPPVNYETIDNESIWSVLKRNPHDPNPELLELKKQAAKKLQIVYYGSPTITIKNNVFVYGDLIIDNAKLSLDNSGDLVGTIVTNADVEMKNDPIIDTNLLYAPNSVVDISGGKVYGPVVGKTVKISGDSKVTYTPTGESIPLPGNGDSGEPGFTKGSVLEQ